MKINVITAPHSAVFTNYGAYKTEKIIRENDAKGKEICPYL